GRRAAPRCSLCALRGHDGPLAIVVRRTGARANAATALEPRTAMPATITKKVRFAVAPRHLRAAGVQPIGEQQRSKQRSNESNRLHSDLRISLFRRHALAAIE